MVDSGKSDEKIIAVCKTDPVYADYEDIHQLPKHLFNEIRHFFTVYKQLESGKVTEIEGFSGREEAIKTIKRAKERYHLKFPNGEE
jgi:inorganic pyrophosphatase